MSKSSSKKADTGLKIIESNKKAWRDYEILETLEAGMQLNGGEVKSIRNGGISLAESYIKIKSSECYLVDCHIAPYIFSRKEELDPTREKKLLLHKKEIEKLDAKMRQKGLTMVPLKVYFNAEGRCKIELGLGKGKKAHDKRDTIKAKENERYLKRVLKNNQ
jgi:SsrA-binding protein